MINHKNIYKTLIGALLTALLIAHPQIISQTKANNLVKPTHLAKSNKVRTAQLIKNSELFQQADNQSKVVKTVLANESIVVHKRQRAWYFVATEQKLTGWLSMLNIRFNGVAKRTGELGISSAFGSLSKNTLPTQSTGIRGFDEADLKKATADLKQLAIVNSYQIPLVQAEEFARQGQLKANMNIEVK